MYLLQGDACSVLTKLEKLIASIYLDVEVTNDFPRTRRNLAGPIDYVDDTASRLGGVSPCEVLSGCYVCRLPL